MTIPSIPMAQAAATGPVGVRRTAIRRWLRHAAGPFGVFTLTAAVYWITAWRLGHVRSRGFAYWDQLADAFLHGRLHVIDPANTLDMTQHLGKWYVTFPPLPAILLLPWSIVSSFVAVNTVVFSLLVGALNTALVDSLLRSLVKRRIVNMSNESILWLVTLWAVGSVHWYMSVAGSVWFVSQICTATFLLLSLLVAASGRALVAGTLLGIAALGRPTILLALPAVVAVAVAASSTSTSKRLWPTFALLVSLPAGLIAMLLLAYNQARFGSPFDFGYGTQNVAPRLTSDLHTHGQFNLRYVPRNLWALLAAGPTRDARSWKITPDGTGMSVFLRTPAWVFAFLADRRRWLTRCCWLAVALVLVPFMDTGSHSTSCPC